MQFTAVTLKLVFLLKRQNQILCFAEWKIFFFSSLLFKRTSWLPSHWARAPGRPALIWHFTPATSNGAAGAPCWLHVPKKCKLCSAQNSSSTYSISTQELILSRPLATTVWLSTILLNLVGIGFLRHTFLEKKGTQACACTNPCFPQSIFTAVFLAQSWSE